MTVGDDLALPDEFGLDIQPSTSNNFGLQQVNFLLLSFYNTRTSHYSNFLSYPLSLYLCFLVPFASSLSSFHPIYINLSIYIIRPTTRAWSPPTSLTATTAGTRPSTPSSIPHRRFPTPFRSNKPNSKLNRTAHFIRNTRITGLKQVKSTERTSRPFR